MVVLATFIARAEKARHLPRGNDLPRLVSKPIPTGIAIAGNAFKIEPVSKPKPDWRGVDRRRHPRFDVELEISYQHLDDFLFDYAINLSRGGMFIRTARPIELGTEIKIRFSIPGRKEKIETTGKVVRAVRADDPHGPAPGMGIEFKALGEKDIELINAVWAQSRAEKSG